MKLTIHIIAALGLFLSSLIIQGIVWNDSKFKRLDTVRLYTISRLWVDPSSTSNPVGGVNTLTPACLALTNLTTDAACLSSRQSLQTSVLNYFQCNQYRSQVCTFLSKILSGLATNSSTYAMVNGVNTSFPYVAGKPLTSTKQALIDSVNGAQDTFRIARQADQSAGKSVIRSVLFTFIQASIFGTCVFALLTEFQPTYNWLGYAKVPLAVILVTLTLFSAYSNTGAGDILLIILLPAFFILVWYEWFMPRLSEAKETAGHCLVTSILHPFFFSIIYSCVVVLALVENDVTDFNLIITELLKAQAVAMLFMSVTYFALSTGIHEEDLNKHTAPVLKSKEASYTLLVSSLLIMMHGVLLVFSPFAYSRYSLFMLSTPAIVAGLSLFTTLWVERLHLDDAYGLDRGKDSYPGGKLYACTFFVLFGLVLHIYMYWEHITTYRASTDNWGTGSIQFDVANAYLLPSGL